MHTCNYKYTHTHTHKYTHAHAHVITCERTHKHTQTHTRMHFSDDRVSDWFLMQSFWPTLALTAAYLTIVYYGQRAMLHRTAFEFPTIMFLYNAFLVALNFHIFYEVGWLRSDKLEFSK